MHNYYVHMMTNWTGSVLYTGVTNDLERRVYEHKRKLVQGFTAKCNLNKLVYYEHFTNINAHEKQIKGWLRSKKNALVATVNPNWNDLNAASDAGPSLRSG